MISQLVYSLLVILVAGLLAGFVCKRLRLSMLIGYMVAGAIIGHGGLGLVGEEMKEIEYLARAGALLLLFAIGIEFSLEELARLSQFFFVGGTAQMLLVALPICLACMLFGVAWKSSLLIAAATALSSTVLVYRALTEWGETSSLHGRRAVGILLFQDAALVPLMLLVPLLVGSKQDLGAWAYWSLALNSLLFVAAIPLLRRVLARWVAPHLSDLQSVELVILFGLIVLIGFCLGAYVAGLPPALGALAAGLVMNGNRLTGQVDALILPYRETFGVIFFVSLGTLFDARVFMDSPVLLCAGLLAVMILKTGAATVALRLTRLPWHTAAGMGLGLAQLGELSFVLLAEGQHVGLISDLDYSRMLFIAMGTLLLTPMLLKYGIQWSRRRPQVNPVAKEGLVALPPAPEEAIVIGLGPMGRQAVSQLEIMGVDVCLIDLSPVNLHAYAQQGFRTVSGDGSDPDVLRRADAQHARLAIVCVPNDRSALQIVTMLCRLNPECVVVVRCRYRSSAAALKKAGAIAVVTEEVEASRALLRLLERIDIRR